MTQKQVRFYLLLIAGLLVFWLFLNTTRYYFIIDQPNLLRFLWYCYYIPLLFIPLICFYTALSLGQHEDYRLSKVAYWLILPIVILLIGVLTNDFHQLVFYFPGEFSSVDYRYGPLYWVVFTFMMGLSLAALIIILVKSRVPRSNKTIWLPHSALAVLFLYVVLYINKAPIVVRFAGNLTISISLLVISMIEVLLTSGLIRNNQNYHELFNLASVQALIVNLQGKIYHQAQSAPSFTLAQRQAAILGPLALPNNIQLSQAKIAGGYVLWVEDFSELRRLIDGLAALNQQLSQENALLQAELDLKARQTELLEREHLYQSFMREIGTKISQLNASLSLRASDVNLAKQIKWCCLVGVYLKRRLNLVILSLEQPILASQELAFSLKETLDTLADLEINSFLHVHSNDELPAEVVFQAYDSFQALLEHFYWDLTAVLVNLAITPQKLVLKMQLSATNPMIKDFNHSNWLSNLLALKGEFNMEAENDTLHLKLTIPRLEKGVS